MHPVCDASISQVHRWRKAVGGACAESTVPHSTCPHCACPICVHRRCLSMAGMVKTWPPPADSKDKSYDSKVNSSPPTPTLIGHASQPPPVRSHRPMLGARRALAGAAAPRCAYCPTVQQQCVSSRTTVTASSHQGHGWVSGASATVSVGHHFGPQHAFVTHSH